MAMRWYVIHAYSGFEGQVKRSLEERIKRAGMEELFGSVLVPTEEVVEMKAGQQRKSERKFFPGYVLVKMDMTDETWHLVKSVPKVMGFIGGTGDKPAPIPDKQVDAILHRLQRSGRGGGLREEPSQGFRSYLWTLHPGGFGVRTDREGLSFSG